jgi:broad specificity polyphosphatase/5'/3'-nucleotidase SurE
MCGARQCADENSRRPIALPAIACSNDVSGGFHDDTAAAKATADVAAIVKRDGLPRGVFLNIDVPAGVSKGTRLTTQSQLFGGEKWIEHKEPARASLFSEMISRNRRCSAARN